MTTSRSVFVAGATGHLSMVSHDDAAAGVPAGIYNVVDDAPVTRRDFAEARSLRISKGKTRKASGWAPQPSTPLDG
jgi:hypothetical protein